MTTTMPAASAARTACALRRLSSCAKVARRVPSISSATRRTGGCISPVYRAAGPRVCGVRASRSWEGERLPQTPVTRCTGVDPELRAQWRREGVDMQSPVLIAYATRSGSTGEVAEAIAAAMEDAGVPTEVLPVSQVTSLAGREALIVGAPLYIGRFPKDFHEFLDLHHEALQRRPLWCFVLGPVQNNPAEFEGARKQAERQLGRYAWLRVTELHVFAGRC